MMYKDILTKEELEALLSADELEAFKIEQQSRLEHELMLSPAHLLLAIRELEDTVMRLITRVAYLEGQAAPHQAVAAPELEFAQADKGEAEPGYKLDYGAEDHISDLSELIAQTMPDVVPETVFEPNIEPTPKIEIQQTLSTSTSSLMSRADRHRERKPSLLSKLLK